MCQWQAQVQPAVEDAASRVEPAAKQVTDGAIRPAGDYVADNAVPITKQIGAACQHSSCICLKDAVVEPFSAILSLRD